MRFRLIIAIVLAVTASGFGSAQESRALYAAEKRLNNLVSVLLEAASIAKTERSFPFERAREGWIFVSADCRGKGTVKIGIDEDAKPLAFFEQGGDGSKTFEAVRQVSKGEHRLRVHCEGDVTVERLVVKAIPELMHCGLGFNSSIKSYGIYDLEFLKRDILPNVTTLVVPHDIELPQSVIDDWHRQGKKFVAEVGINGNEDVPPEEHVRMWTGFLDKAPFLDGIIINEFIINNPQTPPGTAVTPERQKRIDAEQQKHRSFAEAIKKIRADQRYRDKMVYAYFGGSGKKLNQELIGPAFIRTLIDADCRIALERYIFEVSSEQKSKEALQAFVDGIADWVAKEPNVKEKMIISFGLFSMPPGGINKQPNVDYHVWMDQQMHVAANNPVMSGMEGLNWWTTVLADEETVRFVGKLYRHYAIEGKTDLLTKDPLFLSHLQNTDFEKGLEAWTLHPAEEGSIQAKSFPRYGRIEGRYMGLGRPADPEHIGDTFLWMKRSEKGPNTFSQTIKGLQPGRLYSLKMLTCDYQDLIDPNAKTMEEATRFIGKVTLDGVEIDEKKSFAEMYPSNPEPPIPVWITYHWTVFRAKGTTAKITVSDWEKEQSPTGPFGQEQTFNFLELQPYHE